MYYEANYAISFVRVYPWYAYDGMVFSFDV